MSDECTFCGQQKKGASAPLIFPGLDQVQLVVAPGTVLHLHMLLPDGVYFQDDSGRSGFHRTPPPTGERLHCLLHQIADRVARFLERDEGSSYLTRDRPEGDPLQIIHSHSVNYRVAIGPRKGLEIALILPVLMLPIPGSEASVNADPALFLAHIPPLKAINSLPVF